MLSASIHSDFDPAKSVLSDSVQASSPVVAQAAIAGLGIAYAGHNRADILELLEPVIANTALAPQTSALAALSVGLVGIASCSRTLAEAIVSTLLDRDGAKLKTEPLYRYFPLGLALLYLGTSVCFCAATPHRRATDGARLPRTRPLPRPGAGDKKARVMGPRFDPFWAGCGRSGEGGGGGGAARRGAAHVGRQQAAEATLDALQAVPAPLSQQAIVLVKAFAYAGALYRAAHTAPSRRRLTRTAVLARGEGRGLSAP